MPEFLKVESCCVSVTAWRIVEVIGNEFLRKLAVGILYWTLDNIKRAVANEQSSEGRREKDCLDLSLIIYPFDMPGGYAGEHSFAFSSALNNFILPRNILIWAPLTDGIAILGNEEGRAGSIVCVHVFETSVGCIKLSEQRFHFLLRTYQFRGRRNKVLAGRPHWSLSK